MSKYTFKFATEDWEFDQIHSLNYQAFVEEIPQHAPNLERRLVDQFHDQNTYAIGLDDDAVIAMLALRSQRPFSLDKKLEDLDNYLPSFCSMCEIRLLYIRPEHRNGKVMRSLMEMVAEYSMQRGHDLALISGTTRQQRLYKHLGFAPFGPLVGSGDALFQPMYLTLDAANRTTPWVHALREQQIDGSSQNGDSQRPDPVRHKATDTSIGLPPPMDPPVNFLPGPVNIPAAVRKVFGMEPVSHRADQFMADVQTVKRRLCKLVGAGNVELLFGSGTLANEAVAAQISLLNCKGVVLSNGEFGNRLVDQATRWRLDFEALHADWGAPFDYGAVERMLEQDPKIGWLWCVHSETSTGVLNDLTQLIGICQKRNVRLCLDCISSIGAVPVALRDVYLATGTSGKALASFSGIAMVFYNHSVSPAPHSLPRYLDLGYYAATNGVPFTILSDLLYALRTALDYFEANRFTNIERMAQELRKGLAQLGMQVVVAEKNASPAVTTIVLPTALDSVWLGDQLLEQGYLLSYKSQYLVKRNWIQVCLMGEFRGDTIPAFLDLLGMLTEPVGVTKTESNR